jgi:hypothetical protein
LRKNFRYLTFLLFLLYSAIFAQEAGLKQLNQLKNQDVKEHFEQSKLLSQNVAQLTGMALEPLLVIGAIGAYKYLTSSEEAKSLLPWYYMPWFWLICLIVYAAVHFPTALSVIGFPSQISSAFKAGGKVIGLVVTSPIIFDQVTTIARTPRMQDAFSSAQPYQYLSASFVPWEWFSGTPEIIWFITIAPMLFFIFFAMWLLNFVFDMLTFLSPFGFIDALLEFFRIVFYTVLLVVAIFLPQLVFFLVIPLAFISIISFGWSVRRTVMGFVFIRDFINRKKETSIDEQGIAAFAGPSLGCSNKCYGKLTKKDEYLLFSYKKYFLLRKAKIINSSELVLKKEILYSNLYSNGVLVCTLPLRYQKIAEKVKMNLNVQRIEDGNLKKGLNGMIEWIKEFWSKNKEDFSLVFYK